MAKLIDADALWHRTFICEDAADVRKEIETAPTVETVPQWIPVTERLPEDPLQTVLVTNGKETCVAVYSAVYDEFGVMCGRGQDKRFGVTHWMPLPQPPKGE